MAVVRLEEIWLWNTKLTPEQFQKMFNKIATCENLKLTELSFGRNDLSSIKKDVLVKAISRLETVDIRFAVLTPAQIKGIFTLVAERTSSTLRKVRLCKSDVVPGELCEKGKENSAVQLDLLDDDEDESDSDFDY